MIQKHTWNDLSSASIFQSYTLNITTVQGFETFMSSLKNKCFNPTKEDCGVDLILSCVDNYEARMVVNQVKIWYLLDEHLVPYYTYLFLGA